MAGLPGAIGVATDRRNLTARRWAFGRQLLSDGAALRRRGALLRRDPRIALRHSTTHTSGLTPAAPADPSEHPSSGTNRPGPTAHPHAPTRGGAHAERQQRQMTLICARGPGYVHGSAVHCPIRVAFYSFVRDFYLLVTMRFWCCWAAGPIIILLLSGGDG